MSIRPHAIVLSFDEKSQIQAFDRTQPGLPLKKGRAGAMTHDYKRKRGGPKGSGLEQMLARKPRMLVTVALDNKRGAHRLGIADQ